MSTGPTGESPLPAAPPGVTLDAAQLRHDVLGYVASQRTPEGLYRFSAALGPTMTAQQAALGIRWMLGEDVPATERRPVVEWFNDVQDPSTGHFLLPTAAHADTLSVQENQLDVSCRAAASVYWHSGRPRFALRFLDEYADPARALALFESRPWSEWAWHASHVPASLLRILRIEGRDSEAWRAAVFAWVEARQDPVTGYWGANIARTWQPFDAQGRPTHDLWQGLGCTHSLAGAYYLQIRRPVPRAVQIAATTLAFQGSDGLWGSGHGTLDALRLLAVAAPQLSLEAQEQIRAAAARALRTVLAHHNADGGFWQPYGGGRAARPDMWPPGMSDLDATLFAVRMLAMWGLLGDRILDDPERYQPRGSGTPGRSPPCLWSDER